MQEIFITSLLSLIKDVHVGFFYAFKRSNQQLYFTNEIFYKCIIVTNIFLFVFCVKYLFGFHLLHLVHKERCKIDIYSVIYTNRNIKKRKQSKRNANFFLSAINLYAETLVKVICFLYLTVAWIFLFLFHNFLLFVLFFVLLFVDERNPLRMLQS